MSRHLPCYCDDIFFVWVLNIQTSSVPDESIVAHIKSYLESNHVVPTYKSISHKTIKTKQRKYSDYACYIVKKITNLSAFPRNTYLLTSKLLALMQRDDLLPFFHCLNRLKK